MKKGLLAIPAVMMFFSCVTMSLESVKNEKKMVPVYATIFPETDNVRVNVISGNIVAYIKSKNFIAYLSYLNRTAYHVNFLLGIKNTSDSDIIETRLSHYHASYIEPKTNNSTFYRPKNDAGETTTVNCAYENEYLVHLARVYDSAREIVNTRRFLNAYYYKNHDLKPGEVNIGVIAFDFAYNPVNNITVKLKIDNRYYAIDFRTVSVNWFPEISTRLNDAVIDFFPENIDEYIIPIVE